VLKKISNFQTHGSRVVADASRNFLRILRHHSIYYRLRLLEIIVIVKLQPIGKHEVLRVPVILFDITELAGSEVIVGLMALETGFGVFGLVVGRVPVLKDA
jgi:hypothetical protein